MAVCHRATAQLQDQREKHRMLHYHHFDNPLGLGVLFPQCNRHSAMLKVKDPKGKMPLPRNRLKIFLNSKLKL